MQYKLTALGDNSLKKAGFHDDGHGLYLRIKKSGTKSLVFRLVS